MPYFLGRKKEIILLTVGVLRVNPAPAEQGYAPPLQTADPDQLASAKKKICWSFSMWIYINEKGQVVWSADN